MTTKHSFTKGEKKKTFELIFSIGEYFPETCCDAREIQFVECIL